MTRQACPICEETASLKSDQQIGYQRSKTYEVYHCNTCASAFVSPLKVDENIYNHIYSKAREVPGYGRYYDYAEKVLEVASPLDYLADEEDVYWGIRQFLKSKKRRALKILEVGCGFGYLTYALSKAGHEVKGIDISHVAVEQAKKKYGDLFECIDVRDLAKRETLSYDAVIFTEVIEHIEDPKGFMKVMDQLLLPGGHLIVTTPNKTPYPEDVLWETEPPPVHLFWLSEKTMNYLAKLMGYQVSFVDFTLLNYQEYRTRGDYFRPSISIRNYIPTRQPRLDEEGQVLIDAPTSIHHLLTTHDKAPLFTVPEFRDPFSAPLPNNGTLSKAKVRVSRGITRAWVWLKRNIQYYEIYPLLKRGVDLLKFFWSTLKQGNASFQEWRRKKKLLKNLPKSRPTLCAIFTKQKALRPFWRF